MPSSESSGSGRATAVTGTLGVAGLARAGQRLLRPRLGVAWWVVVVSMVWLMLISGLH
jgi:hypothetical protein